MAKSYVPRLIQLLEKLCLYIVKHQSTMNPYLSQPQQAFLSYIVTQCQAVFGGINETPQA